MDNLVTVTFLTDRLSEIEANPGEFLEQLVIAVNRGNRNNYGANQSPGT